MNDVLSSRDACMAYLLETLKNDHWGTKFAFAAACELMDLGTLNDLVETVQNWEDSAALRLGTRLDELRDERFPGQP